MASVNEQKGLTMTGKIKTQLNTSRNNVSTKRRCNGIAVTKIYRVVCVVMLFPFCLVLLTSCFMFQPFEYRGDYPELWSTAVSTIPSATGISFNGRQPDMGIIETDQYGRILFAYGEGLLPVFRVIVQRSDDNYAYFYPNYNHMTAPRVGTGYSAVQEQRNLYNEMIENLKIVNNWNQPLSDDNEFDRVRIVRRREDSSTPEDVLRQARGVILSHVDTSPRWTAAQMLFLREDAHGRTLYYWSFRDREMDVDRHWAVIFSADYGFDSETSVVELIGDDYQTDLRLFMEANGWNTPP